MKSRDYQMDNIKGILIILVVFGHMFLAITSGFSWITTLIYSFHMPVFIFLNGLFSKNVTVKKVFRFGLLYFVVQLFYIFLINMTNYPWIPQDGIIFTPIFHVWYLMSLTFWYLITIILKKIQISKVIVFVISIILALLIRFIKFDVDGNYFAYARTLVFLPFFLAGYYMSYETIFKLRDNLQRNKIILSLGAVLFIFCQIKYFGASASKWMRLFFGYAQQSKFAGNFFTFIAKEGIQYILGFAMLLILLGLVPKNEQKLSYLGQHTLSIYIFHPIVYFIVYNNLIKLDPNTLTPVLIASILTIATVAFILIIEKLVSPYFHRK